MVIFYFALRKNLCNGRLEEFDFGKSMLRCCNLIISNLFGRELGRTFTKLYILLYLQAGYCCLFTLIKDNQMF